MKDIQTFRAAVRGTYDLQKLRIQIGNRIVGNFKVKLGQAPGESEKVLPKDAEEILEILRLSYNRVTDGVANFPSKSKFKDEEGVISNYTELCLISEYFEVEEREKKHFERFTGMLEEQELYTEFLKPIKGIGKAMAGIVMTEIDITQAEYPSSLWKYAGLDVVEVKDEKTGEIRHEGRSKRKAHLIDREYIDAAGEVKLKKSITYNPTLKTKLLGVMAPCMLKANSQYKVYYDNYKHRIENDPRHAKKTKMHRHKMALRYMIKRFLVDLYKAWRAMEGLPVAPEYSQTKLGMTHGKA